jgi:BASS family bile acid:Na+ symporter
MTVAELLPLVLRLSIIILVFTIGLGTAPRELTYLARHPGQLIRSLVAMNLVMPLIAVAIAKLFTLDRPVMIMLIALALSPVPPILPKKIIKAGGGHAYVMALLCSAAVVAIVWIPFAVSILSRISVADFSVSPAVVAKVLLMTVIGPVVAGVIVRLMLPKLAERLAVPLGMAATLLLLGGVVLILVKFGPALTALIGDGTLVAIIAYILIALAVGHMLGGPASSDRTVLALATASRHPAVAMAIARATFPAEKTVPVAVLLYLLVGLVATVPYVSWRKKSLAEDAPPPIGHPAPH